MSIELDMNSPAVPDNSKVKKSMQKSSSKKNKASYGRVKIVDYNNYNVMNSDEYAKMICELKDKTITGYNEDIYNLKNFTETASKLETSLWVLKDVFYNFNKELRKQFEEGYDEEYEKEANELEALDAYKSTKNVAEVYQREIKWLRAQNQKINDLLIKTKDKYKSCKNDLKDQNLAWESLK